MQLLLSVNGIGDRIVDAGSTVTVGQLVDALDPPGHGRTLKVERSGAVLNPYGRLGEIDLRCGDRVSIAPITEGTDFDQGNTPQPTATIRMLTGPLAGSGFDLRAGSSRVGRASGNDVVIVDPGISRQHAIITVDEDSVVIDDLGSTNGIQIEGSRIDQPTVLHPGHRLLLGQSWAVIDHNGIPPMPADGRLILERPNSQPRFYQGRTFRPPLPPEADASRRRFLTKNSAPHTLSPAYADQLARFELELRAAQEEERAALAVEAPSFDDVMLAVRAKTRIWERRLDDPHAMRVRLGLAELPSRQLIEVPMGGPPEIQQQLDRLARLYHTVDGVPATVDLGQPGGLSLWGPIDRLRSLVASMVGQLVALNPPDQLGLLFWGTAVGAWDWLKWLPHAEFGVDQRPPIGPAVEGLIERYFEPAAGQTTDPHRRPLTLIIIDGWSADHLADGLPPVLTRLMTEGPALGLSTVVLNGTIDGTPVASPIVPQRAGPILSVDGRTGRLTGAGSPAPVIDPLALEYCSPESAIDLARMLAPLVPYNPDDPTGGGGPGGPALSDEHLTVRSLVIGPSSDHRFQTITPGVGLAGSANGAGSDDPTTIGNSDEAGGASRPTLGPLNLLDLPQSDEDDRLVLGIAQVNDHTAPTVFSISPSKTGTLALVGGPGTGVSDCLLAVAGAAARLSGPPERLPQIYGFGVGGSMAPLASLPMVVGLADDDPNETVERLAEIEQLLGDRLATLELAGALTVDDFRQRRPGVTLTRVLVLVDGLASMVARVETLRPGRARQVIGQLLELGQNLGVHLVFTVASAGEVDPILAPKVERWLTFNSAEPGQVTLGPAFIRFATLGPSGDRAAAEATVARLVADLATRPVAPVAPVAPIAPPDPTPG